MGTEHTFEFRGRAGEWFGIWIVNLLLSIITIGIYSAWAKVRRLKYFYNNTYIDGRNFDYHATGKQILIGRLIFIGAYILLSIIAAVVPVLGIILFLAVFVAIPWLLVRSMKFNARMTSFSNVRLDFQGTGGKAFMVFFLLPIGLYLLVALLIGGGAYLSGQLGSGVIGAPLILLGAVAIPVGFALVDRAVKLFSISNHFLGNAQFGMEISLRPFIVAQMVALAWVILVFLIGMALTGFNPAPYFQAFAELDSGTPSGDAVAALVLFYVMIFAAFIPAAFIYQALVRNAVYNHTQLAGGHTFRSNISAGQYFWIAFSNLLVVVVSLGLMLPWAQIRMTKYLADHTHATPGSSLDDFVGEQVAAGHAVGDAFTDFEAIDVGLPV